VVSKWKSNGIRIREMHQKREKRKRFTARKVFLCRIQIRAQKRNVEGSSITNLVIRIIHTSEVIIDLMYPKLKKKN